MKAKFTLLTTLILIFWTANLSAQNLETAPKKECRTQAGQASVDYERSVDRAAYKQLMRNYLKSDQRAAIEEYAIQIHIVTRDDGSGGVDIDDIRGEIDVYVNPYFADIDIEFVECAPELYHASTEYYVLGNGDEDPDVAGDAMSAAFNVANVINIYFVDDPDEACGWARFPWKLPADYIVLANSCADNQSTLVHELGHYFGLYHTHETGLGAESVTRDSEDGCWDCEDDGDLLCDTQASPNISDLADNWPSCAYTGVGTDACNGDAYMPDIDNIMSYADKECRVVFTNQQLARMEVFRDGDRDYLQTGCSCEKAEALCKNINIDLNANGNVSITQASVDNGSTWDCGLDSWSVNPNSFDCGDVGANIVTLTVTDDLGWESSCQSTVTVADVTKPMITTQASDMDVECDGSGNVGEFTAWLNDNGGAQVTDACDGSWSNNSSGLSNGCGATGSETVTFTYTDPSGNTASTTATFTIEDNTDPDLVCPADIHLPECIETAEWIVVSSDICSNVTVVSDPPSGSVFEKGTTTVVTVTSTDECDNVSECTFEVTRDPDLKVDIDPLATSPLNTCAAGTNANIVIGYGGGPTCTTMNAVGSGGHAPYTYSWEAPVGLPEGSFENENTATPTFCADFQTEPCVTYTFTVTVTDIHGCTETNEVEVNVVNPLCTSGNNPKVSVCHRPPGNPSNEQTICISANAVDNHLDNDVHQDCLGSCDDVCVAYSPENLGLVASQGNNDPDENILRV
ncbi:MAG: HYR domain-containing protein, partial [Saprospiraceae bacterium]|nr:HYR domain-containing protein [Saprospiraceae bacterium]